MDRLVIVAVERDKVESVLTQHPPTYPGLGGWLCDTVVLRLGDMGLWIDSDTELHAVTFDVSG
jgi:hypothetical protein